MLGAVLKKFKKIKNVKMCLEMSKTKIFFENFIKLKNKKQLKSIVVGLKFIIDHTTAGCYATHNSRVIAKLINFITSIQCCKVTANILIDVGGKRKKTQCERS
jgi:RNase H-fold protein (predicted Holliday junction resolvase)